MSYNLFIKFKQFFITEPTIARNFAHLRSNIITRINSFYKEDFGGNSSTIIAEADHDLVYAVLESIIKTLDLKDKPPTKKIK